MTLLKNMFRALFWDIKLLFQNFFHWNFSKLIIWVFSFILALLSFLPFFVVLIILWVIDPIPWWSILLDGVNESVQLQALSAFSESPVFLVVELFISVIWIAFALGVFSYKSILFFELYESYNAWDRKSLWENISLYHFKKYLKAFPVFASILLVYILAFVLIILFIIFVSWGFLRAADIVASSTFNFVSVSSLAAFVSFFLLFCYTFYRLIFGFIFLTETDSSDNHVNQYFRLSYYKTRPAYVFWVFLVFMFLFWLIKYPVDIYRDVLNQKNQELEQYFVYTQTINSVKDLPAEQQAQFLESVYGTTDQLEFLVDRYQYLPAQELQNEFRRNDLVYITMTLFAFFCLYGVYEMILYSFYRHLLRPLEHTKKSRLRKIMNYVKKWWAKKRDL